MLKITHFLKSKKTWFYILISLLLIALPFMVSEYITYVVVLTLFYAMIVSSYDLLLGYAGQLSFCQGAFYGIGAYASALFSIKAGFPVYLSIPLSVVITALVAAGVGYPALRLRGAYFAVTTFFLAHFVYLIFLNEVWLTNGPLGLRGIKPLEALGGIDFSSTTNYYYLVLVCFAASIYILYRTANSNLGKMFISVREDEDLAESFGINTSLYKLVAFVISALVAGIAGGLFAHFFRLLHPSTFTWLTSEMVVIMTLVGGIGTIFGPLIGASVVMFILEFLRFAPELRFVIWAVALIIILIYEPRGLVGLVERIRRVKR